MNLLANIYLHKLLIDCRTIVERRRGQILSIKSIEMYIKNIASPLIFRDHIRSKGYSNSLIEESKILVLKVAMIEEIRKDRTIDEIIFWKDNWKW